ncbi:hypothetical protein IWW50_000831 [Coemansia erecta]|nr:hypothetical protein GGF43_003324 [Coemansia sp. RSA 2618]KAJ2829488.1 hypothetical protein IWW50_000831 [Coemansia erecta]
MYRIYGLRNNNRIIALAALTAVSLVALYSNAARCLAFGGMMLGSSSEYRGPGSWMALSSLVQRSKPESNTRQQNSAYSRFEAAMQHAHYAANGESLHSYCGETNFNDAFIEAAEHRYGNVSQSAGRVFVAVNLFNSERVLPNMATQLLAFAEMLGRKRVFLSVYENGSTDNTKGILRAFAQTLGEMGIPHKITTDDKRRPQLYHRIEYMAAIRNRALEPLYSSNTYDRVVFINDVYFCLPDLLELLHQAQFHDTHLACAEDFDTRHGALEFYDTWVSRDMLGQAFKNRYQNIAADGMALVGQLRNRPFQAQCCWNGMAVLDARVFSGASALRFRRSSLGECSASECSLLCNDLWKSGRRRVVVVPRVKVSYNVETRDRLRQPHSFPRDAPFGDQPLREITFRPGPESVYCNPLNRAGSRVPDGAAFMVDLK